MTLETILTDAVGHFAAGFVLSIGDYATHRYANPREGQLIDKESVMKSMEFIVSAQEKFEKGDKSEKLTWQYGQNIEGVRNHLESKGLIKSNKGFLQNTKHSLKSLWYDQRVNDKTLNQKIARVAIVEGAYS